MNSHYRFLVLLASVVMMSVVDTSAQKKVEIKTADGADLGYLQLDSAGTRLLLINTSGPTLPIGECGDELRQETNSPTGARTARTYVRNCGATVDFATQVSIAANDDVAVVAVFRGRPSIKIRWRSDDALEITHSALAARDIFKKETEALGVAVVYSVAGDTTGATEQKYLDLANVNYGATGLAAGIPREILLRSAGWSQEASGLHREEWGHWFSESPYGDDPHGESKIKEGFQIFEEYDPNTAQEGTATQDAAQAEVKRSLGIAIDAAMSLSGVDSFAAAAQPYGPLDLVVARSPDARYTHELRAFFYGAVARGAGVSKDKAIALLNEFHCGPPCAEARMQMLSSHLDSIREIVSQFRDLDGISVIAAWPGGDFRVGELVYAGGAYVVMKPSPQLGLWPWDTQPTEDPETLLEAIGTGHDSLSQLVERMRNAEIVAIVGSDDGVVRAVMAGSIGPNEAGLVFAKSKKQLPKINVPQLDGRTVVAMRQLAKGLYFYTST